MDRDRESCPVCQDKELQQLRRDLAECKKRNQNKDKKIKILDKRVFILTLIAIGIGAIVGKEALDKFVEWIDTINGVRGGMDELIFPSPGALALFGIALFSSSRKRRD
jgi:uncharacterized hydantoinase/oxoprolinase family protein|tara:strand:+ start:279 stop:602 length:324 start_codon:yes stop_codon:yes gene_type:complete